MKFENVNFPEHIGFKCKNCGLCCKEQPADLNYQERKKIEDMGFTNFLDNRDQTEPRLIKSKNCGCFFLSDNNNCAINDIKPAICRLVPFVVMDWDYDKNIIEVDLPVDCSCPGIFIGNEFPLETIAKAAQSFVHELLDKVAKDENLSAADQKVLSKTRIQIMKMATDDKFETT